MYGHQAFVSKFVKHVLFQCMQFSSKYLGNGPVGLFFDFLQEDYLMLCPDHSSVRFPNEKSKSWDNVSKVRDMPSIV